MSIQINAAFDSGNIKLVGIEGDRVDLEIVKDHLSDFYQWFHFRLSGAKGRTLTFRILNAGGAAYAFGWPDYETRWSSDREAWRTTPTSYEGGVLEFTRAIDTDIVWFAYFAPYSMERHHDLVSRIALQPGVRHRELGVSLDGQPIDCLTIGDGPKQVWLYARQHPGETMAEWWMEGALEKLTDPEDASAQALRAKATFHLVPNMNPDGSRRGHLRTNAAGVNLNREWHAPTPERSPEVLAVRNAMDETGVTFAIDVHGDEAIPANFIAGFEGIPSWTDALGEKFYEYARRLDAATPDFQLDLGYEKSAPGQANLSMSTNQLAERFGAVSMTLEMPFKDHVANADPEFAWSPARCKALGAACLETLAGFIDEL
ncbi:M14-type cytosolic carboxypeptidase [Sphingomonas sp. MMS12-HWE2-04]|uniref:M14 family metallopeptidase n=1 Tax=Sphingomonas sp. MMS12-HWE2-04 TaxID=3234199 RepID=UPI00384DC824